MIKVTSLNKYYNKNKSNQIHVINDVTLTLPDTGFVTILGASGSGKTTLLNVLGGLDKASGTFDYNGTILNGYNASKIDAYRRENFGYIFQNYNLLLNETVYNNLRIALQAINFTDKQEVDKRINFALKAVGLYHYRKKLASALSGGQMQRVSIARALVKNSKVIIADEPTGNLDSTNSIEIMNILKELSKKSLILLVTHDKRLADIFSDEIIEIVDGKIVDFREGNKNTTYEAANDNNVYLQDMKLQEHSDGTIAYKFYSENETENKVDITLVEHNGTIYIQSSRKLRLIDESPITLIDDHYKETIVKEDYNFDTSWYRDSKVNNKKQIFFDTLKNAFKAFCHVKVRTIFFYIAMALIGLVVAFLNITLSSYYFIDSDGICDDPDLYQIKYSIDKDPIYALDTAYKNGLIEYGYDRNYDSTYSVTTTFSSYTSESIDFKAKLLDMSLLKKDNGNTYKYLAGRAPKDSSEVVLGKKTADYIIEKSKSSLDYDDLLGQEIGSGGGYLYLKAYTNVWFTTNTYSPKGTTIVGISSKNTYAVYSDIGFMDSYSIYYDNYDKYWYGYDIEIGYYEYEKDTYKIVYGSDIIPGQENVCLANANQFESITDFNMYGLGKTIGVTDSFGNETECTIVGVFSYKDDTNHVCTYIVNNHLEVYETCYLNIYSTAEFAHKIVEGREPENDDEIIVSAYNSIDLDSWIDGKHIVGKFVCTSSRRMNTSYGFEVLSLALGTTKSIKDKVGLGYNCSFTTSKYDELEAYLDSQGFEIVTHFEGVYSSNLQENKNNKSILFVVIIVLIAISLIYIYFSLRSRMIGDIYTIGVYRAIGYSKNKIRLKYAFETFFISIFTTELGYILVTIIYVIINKKLAKIGEGLTDTVLNNVAAYPLTYVIGALIIILSVLIGLIPISSLMRKTPSEIISKYDI